MTDRAAESPFTDPEAGIPQDRTGSGSPSSKPTGLRGSSKPPPASTASGPVALTTQMNGRLPPRGMAHVDCACGTAFMVRRLDPSPGIRAHQETARHQQWRAMRGID